MTAPPPGAASRLLDALDPEQRQVAEALRGPVRVLAGAGTGKTRAITHRIAHGVATGVYAPSEVLAVTFTTRAAGEMRGRLRTLGAGGVQARTFHSAALRQLRYFWPHVHGTELPTLTESKLPMVGSTARRLGLSTDQATLRDLASEIEWAKVSNVRPDEYAELAERRGRGVARVAPAEVARVLDGYEQVKRDQGRMDMEDVLLLNAGLLADDERVAAQVRRQYKWFVVDEFQDVSPLQSALLDLWLGGRHEICVVGDPAQTIYSFAGADARYLLDFPAKHEGTTSIDLVRNYRSTPEVVAAANTLLGAAPGARQSVELRSQQTSGPAVDLAGHPDEVAEARDVAARVARLRAGGTDLGEMAVLYRINAQSEAYEDALTDLGIPYVVRGAARFFDRGEVREGVTRLRGAARSGEGAGADWPAAVRAVLGGMGWTASAPTVRGQARDRWESLQALVSQADQQAGTLADLGAFVDDLDRRAAEQHAPVAAGVSLSTFHAAKGLEWDAVFCVGVQDGTVPFQHADTPSAVEEERRLLYVGFTRARRDLTVTWAAARNPGQNARRRPSRFLDPLLPDQPVRAPKSKGRGARTCRGCGLPLTPEQKKRGRCDDCPTPFDPAVFERLREWRRARAADDGKPAFMVFSDDTLEQLAEHRPGTTRALLGVRGVGPSKVELYGDDVLEVLAAEQPA